MDFDDTMNGAVTDAVTAAANATTANAATAVVAAVQEQNRATELSRDDRILITTLREYAHWPDEKIAQETGHTVRQVQWACTHPQTPQKPKSGRRPLSRTPGKQQIKEWIEADVAHRRVRLVLPPPFNNYSEREISTALKSLGFSRAVRPRHISWTPLHTSRARK